MLANFSRQLVLPLGPEVLFKVKGMQRQRGDPADGEGVILPVDRHAQQAAGGGNVIRRHLLTEIFQRRQRPLAGLNLIEDDERLARQDALPGQGADIAQQPLGDDAVLKILDHLLVRLQVEISGVFKMRPPEFPQDIRLTDLPCAAENQRHPARLFFLPGKQLGFNFSFHSAAPPSVLGYLSLCCFIKCTQ